MIVKLTPDYKFVCDRCGKEQFPDEKEKVEIHEVRFEEFSDGKFLKSAGVFVIVAILTFGRLRAISLTR